MSASPSHIGLLLWYRYATIHSTGNALCTRRDQGEFRKCLGWTVSIDLLWSPFSAIFVFVSRAITRDWNGLTSLLGLWKLCLSYVTSLLFSSRLCLPWPLLD